MSSGTQKHNMCMKCPYCTDCMHSCTHSCMLQKKQSLVSQILPPPTICRRLKPQSRHKDLACVLYVSHPSLSLTSLHDRGFWHWCLQTDNHTSALHISSDCGRERCQGDLWPHSSSVSFILVHCVAFDWTV